MNGLLEQFKEKSKVLSSDRIALLEGLIAAINDLRSKKADITIAFICTHNSRRSQLGECLFEILAQHLNQKDLNAVSAGTETTAFNHRMVEALASFGVGLDKNGPNDNPLYIQQLETKDKYYYSKTIEDIRDSIDILVTVCGDAEQNCPLVPGIFKRIHIGYKDPKWSDDTAEEKETYQNKVLEIGAELYYVMKGISNK